MRRGPALDQDILNGSRYQTLSTLANLCPSSSQTCCCPARDRKEPGEACSLARRCEWERRCLDLRRRRHHTQSTRVRTREAPAVASIPQSQRSSGTSTTPENQRKEMFKLWLSLNREESKKFSKVSWIESKWFLILFFHRRYRSFSKQPLLLKLHYT